MSRNKDRIPADSYLDKADQEVRVGDFIAYGHALGRSAGLQFGRVEAIFKIKRKPGHWEDKRGETECYDWRITVRGVDDHHDWRESTLNWRLGTLMFRERTIKVTNVIPEKIKKLYEAENDKP